MLDCAFDKMKMECGCFSSFKTTFQITVLILNGLENKGFGLRNSFWAHKDLNEWKPAFKWLYVLHYCIKITAIFCTRLWVLICEYKLLWMADWTGNYLRHGNWKLFSYHLFLLQVHSYFSSLFSWLSCLLWVPSVDSHTLNNQDFFWCVFISVFGRKEIQ